MQFVKDDVRSVFGENVRYRAGDSGQQSFSVVKGLAWASFATDAITDVRMGVSAEIKNILGKDDVQNKIKALVNSIGDAVTDEVVKALSSVMARNPSSVNTKRKIAKYATGKAREILAQLKSNGFLNEKIKDVTSELLSKDEIKKLFSNLQNKLGRSTIYAKLPTPSVSDVSLPDLKDMNLELDDVVNGLAIAIIYITMLCIPGVGWLLAAIMALGAAAFIKNLLAKGPDDVIDNGKIRQAAGKIAGKKEEIKQKVYEALGSAKQGGYLCAVSDSIADIITDVKMQELDALEGLADYKD